MTGVVNTSPGRPYSVPEAADALGVSRGFVRQHLEELGAFRCGRVYRIPREGVEAYKDRYRVSSRSVGPRAGWAAGARVVAMAARREALGT